MAKTFDRIEADMAEWIQNQHMFFVGTAPMAGDGLVNCSPKGLDSFAMVDGTTVAYLDLTGSGVETVAHVQENGRIVIMFCAFEGAPRIVRLHGTGHVVMPNDTEFAELQRLLPEIPGVRSIIRVNVSRISDSCGYGVPFYEYVGQRDTMVRFAEQKGPEGLRAYQAENNTVSLDGLPGVDVA